jgi:phenylalanyl-tRNA synthetase alpha chain
VAKDEVKDSARETLQSIQKTQSLSDQKLLADLKKRKLVTTGKDIAYTVRKGPKYAKELTLEATDLTADMLASGAWESTNFKPYNFKALGAAQDHGALHPLNKVRAEFRAIFFNQGFVEMPTNRYVSG